MKRFATALFASTALALMPAYGQIAADNNSAPSPLPISGVCVATFKGLPALGVYSGGKCVMLPITPFQSPLPTNISDTNYTILPTDSTINVTKLTASRTIQLGLSATYSPGNDITIMDVSKSASVANMIIIAPTGSEVIGSTSNPIAIATPGQRVILRPMPSGGFGSP